ncbi:unnamed protein product [Phaedon cochleariae]|uniref:ATP-dependent DNA helicase n=1 Tax=Phaedon cochleariae TaxID=80249 RepID=A0A9N9X2K7_PHACE|nr:unnamed protein product [Phaedon cochleariae]
MEGNKYNKRKNEAEGREKKKARRDEIFHLLEKNTDLKPKLILSQKERYKSKNKETITNLRKNESYRTHEIEVDLKRKLKLTQTEEYRSQKKKKIALLREDEAYRSHEKELGKEHKIILRQDDTFKSHEKERDRKHKIILRQDDEYRSNERKIDKESKVLLRSDDVYRALEKQKDKEKKKALRTNEKYRSKQKDSQKIYQSQLRESDEFLIKKKIAIQDKRNDEFYHSQEKEKNKIRTQVSRAIENPYACLCYIINYINKSDRGVSALMQAAMVEIQKGNMTVKEQLKKIGNVFINASEVSAQEAAYNILGMSLSVTSTNFVYINTRPSNERVRMLKSKQDLVKMDSNDRDIFKAGVIENYIQRPDILEKICLAEFAAYYSCKRKVENSKNELKLEDGSGVLTKKKFPNIISYCSYGFLQNPIDFYREQIMLYHPWRDEVKDIENVDQMEIYQAAIETIDDNRTKFDKINQQVLDEASKAAEEKYKHLYQHVLDDNFDEEYIPYASDAPNFNPLQFLDGPQKNVEKQQTTFPTPIEIENREYIDIISTLNSKQYEYLNHVLDNIINGKVIYNLVCGGAGVGKSRLITAIQQSVIRYYNSIPGNDPETIKVLLTAPTGKAACGIGGITLHSTFALPVNQYNKELIPLNQDTVNTIHSNLFYLKLLIIDEFSMVGTRMFHHVHERLKQIYKTKKDFGGISVILFGDLRQLAPVGDSWIFTPYKGNHYSAICGTLLWDNFKYFELTEIMRQRDDKLFALALNNMAMGEMTMKDIDLVCSRKYSNDILDTLPPTIVHLFKSNAEVDAFNTKKLSEYKTESFVSIAKDVVKGQCSEKVREMMLKQARSMKKSDCFGLAQELLLQIDAKYMITVNLNTLDGIVNGASCILRHVEKDESEIPQYVWIEFIDDKSESMMYPKINAHKRHCQPE